MIVKKSKLVKVLIVICLALAVIVPFSCSRATYSNNYDFVIDRYRLDAVIDDNGDMHVVEKVTNKYHNRNTVFYKNLIYGKNNSFSSNLDKSSLVQDVRVKVEDSSGIVFDTDVNENTDSHFVGYSYKGDKDELGQYIRCETGVSNCAMIFYYDMSGISDLTTFTYEYTIKGVITQYGDISELNWVMLGYQPMNVKDVEISITLPEGNYKLADQHTWFHGTNNATREFVSDNKVVIKTDKLVKDEQIEVRFLVNKNIFSNINFKNKVSTNRLEDIIEFQLEQTTNADIIYFAGAYGSVIIFVVILLYLALLTIRCYKKYDKEFKSDFYNEYYRELPASYSPALMGYLFKFKELDDDDLSASLLDLIRRGYLILENRSTSVNDRDPDFMIKLNEEKGKKGLSESEKHLIKWFIDDIGDGHQVHIRDLNSYCDDYTNAQIYQNNNTTWYRLVEKESNKYDFFDESIKNAKIKYTVLGSLAFVGVFCLAMLAFVSELTICSMLAISLVFIVIAFIIYVSSFNRRSKAGNEDFVRWRAFKKFLEEFSNFEDYPVPSLIIWEHYLVYATSFGIADKVTEQLKLKFKMNEFGEINDVDTTFIFYYGLRYNYMMNFNRNIRYSRTNAVNTISRHNASRVGVGRSSGGGFSGGSSFGGGGGSFGGR